MPTPRLPKAERAIIAAHEAGMHDRKPIPETCRDCAAEATRDAVRTIGPSTRVLYAPAAPKSQVPKGPTEPITVEAALAQAAEAVAPQARVYTTREEWLLAAVEAMRPDFAAVDREVPEVRISIGWPGGRSARLDPLGQCWHPSAVGDGITAIFITPSQDDPVQVLATTRHEMVHAAGEMNHRNGFRKLAAQVGFDPQPGKDGVSSTYRTTALQERLEALNTELGPFPHSPVNKGSGGTRPETQGTRMLKVSCENDGYTVRATKKWLEQAVPSCPLCDTPMEVEW